TSSIGSESCSHWISTTFPGFPFSNTRARRSMVGSSGPLPAMIIEPVTPVVATKNGIMVVARNRLKAVVTLVDTQASFSKGSGEFLPVHDPFPHDLPLGGADLIRVKHESVVSKDHRLSGMNGYGSLLLMLEGVLSMIVVKMCGATQE